MSTVTIFSESYEQPKCAPRIDFRWTRNDGNNESVRSEMENQIKRAKAWQYASAVPGQMLQV